MSEEQFLEILQEALVIYEDEKKDEGEEVEISMRTFEDAQLMTNNKGIVVTINGARFQVQIQEDPHGW